MWIAQIIKSDGSIINEYLLRGKEIKIGREMGVDYLPTIYNNNIDKTLSRDHARIVINDDILSIVDNNSKFGTFTDNKPNSKITENYQIKSGQIIKFGQANTRIRFIKCPYVFCTSQYYKDEKEKIKRAAKILGSRVSSNVDDASHLVCPKYSATTKILTAIVMEKKIVSINWLSFIEENSKFSLIPSCNEYAPTIHEMMGSYQETAHLSRSSLLKNYTIFITTKTDTQYASIFKSCGSNLIDLSHIEDPVLLKGTIKNTDLSNNNKAACIFYDTANYKTGLQSAPLLDSSFLNENESIGDENIPILWLSAENLARAVIKNEEPLLVKYITTSGKSQISSQKSMTYQYNFDSLNQNNNASPLPPNSPTANAKLNIVIPSIVQQTSLKLTHTKEQTIDVSKPIVPIFVSDSQKLKVPASQPETMNDTHNEEEIVVQQQKQRSSHKRERNLDEFDENIENKISKRRESTKKSHNDDEIFQESNNDVRVTNHNNIIEEVDDEIKDPLMELQALQEYEDMNKSNVDNDGWIAPPPLNLRKAIAEKYRKTLDEEYKYLEPAETKKVKNLVRMIVIDRSKANKHSRNPKDQRKFRKNIVFFASNDELLNCKDMDKVLPKESSREKQLRLEEELIEEDLVSDDDDDDDVILAKHFGGKKTTTRKTTNKK